MNLKTWLLFICLLAPVTETLGLCKKWGDFTKADLDEKYLEETSSLAQSFLVPDRLYQMNDSGDGPNIYLTDLKGTYLGSFELLGVKPRDVEALGSGACPDQKAGEYCLYVGDIGDNLFRRQDTELTIVKEQVAYPPLVDPVLKMKMRYPDGPHNAEGMALHPNGDLIIITKEMTPVTNKVSSANIYRLKREQMKAGTEATLEKLGELDIPSIIESEDGFGQIVTGFDIHPSGTKLLILTYTHFLEVKLDFTRPFPPVKQWRVGVDYQLVKTPELPQQESIIYGRDEKFVFITSEKRKGKGPYLLQGRCLD